MKKNNFSPHSFRKNFIRCGLIGWSAELFFTCFHNLAATNDKRLIGQTSLLMFPIYGFGTLIPVISGYLKKLGIFLRGSIYAVLIFLMEYLSGSFLRLFNACPWDYTGESRYQINGLIRLDFFPFWFLLGLLFERTGLRK
ncbi:MAG: hypothetical protein Q4F21_09960 [Lachnospiraceae bacterium]|nr:hypothetical protein [Lachnospiraceae bacterium]